MLESTLANILAVAAAISVVGGGIAALWRWIIRPISRGIARAAHFFEDWFGEPARPGHPAVRGVMERLERVEHQTSRAEFHLGNGNPEPMRHIVEDTQADMADVKRRLADVEQTVEVTGEIDTKD